MSYFELRTADLQPRAFRRTFKIHCHLLLVQETPFPKIFVTDYLENEDFLARLDFLTPIDLENGMILPEEIFGVKIYRDKMKSLGDILTKNGIGIEGPKVRVLDKLIFLTLSIRLHKFQSRSGLLLEGIMDELELLRPDSKDRHAKDLFGRFLTRFEKSSLMNTPNFQDLTTKLNSVQNIELDSIKTEETTIPFDMLNLEEFEQSSGLEEDTTAGHLAFKLNSVEKLQNLVKAHNYHLPSHSIFQVSGTIKAIVPQKVREIIDIQEDNRIKLKNITVHLTQGQHSLQTVISNNIDILKFLIGDDISNNSNAQFLRIYYENSKYDNLIERVCKNGKSHSFLLKWGRHQIGDNLKEIKLENWEFIGVPYIEDLI